MKAKSGVGEEPLTTGGLARRVGCNVETIRYYERIGLLAAPPRSPAGHRRYGLVHLKRLFFIRRCRGMGFTLDQVRELLRFADGEENSCAAVRTMTLAHQKDVKRKIADLRKLDRVLGEMATKCDSGTVPDCPVIEALFEGEQ